MSTPWQTFAGCVLVVLLLYWAQAVLVPVALALLFTFVLSTPVAWLERRIGRAAAVLTTAILVFTLLGFASWALVHQLNLLAEDLPHYRVVGRWAGASTDDGPVQDRREAGAALVASTLTEVKAYLEGLPA